MMKKIYETMNPETMTAKDKKEMEEMRDLFAGACSILEERDELAKYARTLEKRVEELEMKKEDAEAEAEFWHGEYNDLAGEMRELREEYKSAVDLTSDYWEECKKTKALADSALSLVEALINPEEFGGRFNLDMDSLKRFLDGLKK